MATNLRLDQDLNATAQIVKDEAGNESQVALSTQAVGIGTATPSGRLEVTGSSPTGDIGLIRLSGNEAAGTLDLTFNGAGISNGIMDDVFTWWYNRGRIASNEPEYSENFESAWEPGAPPAGLMERHGNYTSPDGTVSYRPWGWFLNLNTHEASYGWLANRFTVGNRAGQANDFQLLLAATGAQLTLSNRGTGDQTLHVRGGDFTFFDLNNSLQIRRYSDASASAPILDGPAVISAGKFWNGSSSGFAQAYFQARVTSPPQWWAEIGVQASSLKIGNNGFVGLPSVPFARITEAIVAPNNRFYSAVNTSGTDTRRLIGLDPFNLVTIDPGGIGTKIVGQAGVGGAAIYRFDVTGAPVNTVMLGIRPTSMSSGDVGIFAALPAVVGSVGVMSLTGNATQTVTVLFANSNATSATAHTRFDVQTAGANAGDAYTMYTVLGQTNWSLGIDNSDNDKFKLAPGGTVDNGTILTVTKAGNVGIATTNPSEKLQVTGNIALTGQVIVIGGDCAEEFNVSDYQRLEPGTVMIISDEETLSHCMREYDSRVAGVLSGAGGCSPGIVLGSQLSAAARMPLALTGRVYCKVDARYAPVNVGDLLTTSRTPGHAMKASDPDRACGAILGKALRSLAEGQGLIPVLIALH